jgi:hypothetical protein
MSAVVKQSLSQVQCPEKQSHTVEKIHEKSTRAQQHEKRRLSLYLSFFDVGPESVVPFIERIAVLLSEDKNTCPRKPTVESSQPKGKLFVRRD